MSKNILIIFITLLFITLPFVTKPYHIDEPLFIYSARSLNNNILLPYNFSFPAEDRIRSGFDGFTNPPLNSYFIAIISRFLGEKPIILHSFFIIFAILTTISIFMLSKIFVKNVFFSTLIAITTPVFMLQSHSIMPDIALLGFWCFSIYFYCEGIKTHNKQKLFLSSFFISLSLLLRYSGLMLIPLLLTYSFLKKDNIRSHIVYLLFPLFIFAFWCMHNIFIYGKIHFLTPIIISSAFYIKMNSILPRVILNFAYIGALMIFPVSVLLLLLLKGWIEFRKYVTAVFILWVLFLLYFLYFKNTIFLSLFYGFVTASSLTFFYWIIDDLIKIKDNNEEFYKNYDDLFLLIWVFLIIILQSSLYFTAPKFMLAIVVPSILLLLRLIERKYANFNSCLPFIILISFILGCFISLGDYYQAVFDSKVTPGILNWYSKHRGRNIWVVDQDRNWGYYIPRYFSANLNKHEFKEGDLILGLPYFYFEAIKNKKMSIKLVETRYYDTPLIKVCDIQNNILLYFDGFGKYLPYSLSFRRTPMFIIWEVAGTNN